jgi:hypothetical protein
MKQSQPNLRAWALHLFLLTQALQPRKHLLQTMVSDSGRDLRKFTPGKGRCQGRGGRSRSTTCEGRWPTAPIFTGVHAGGGGAQTGEWWRFRCSMAGPTRLSGEEHAWNQEQRRRTDC